jgi:hypothetical protein
MTMIKRGSGFEKGERRLGLIGTEHTMQSLTAIVHGFFEIGIDNPTVQKNAERTEGDPVEETFAYPGLAAIHGLEIEVVLPGNPGISMRHACHVPLGTKRMHVHFVAKRSSKNPGFKVHRGTLAQVSGASAEDLQGGPWGENPRDLLCIQKELEDFFNRGVQLQFFRKTAK